MIFRAGFYSGVCVGALAGGTPTPTPTPLPEQANILYRFSADDIPAQTDNTALTGWTDSVSALTISQATGANRPKYRTSRTGGKPAVQFEGNQWLTVGRPAALLSAMGNANTTTGYSHVFVVANTLAASDATYGGIFGSGVLGRYWTICNGTREGCDPPGGQNWIYDTGAGFRVFVMTMHSERFTQFFHNGTCYGNPAIPPASAPANNFALGACSDAANYTSKTDLMEWVVYNKALTWGDVLRVVKWAHDKYGQAYPWAGAEYFSVFDGDSQTAGDLAAATSSPNYSSSQNCYPARLARAKSLPKGWWTNLARSGRQASHMVTNGSQIDEIAGIVGKPVILSAFEFYNSPSATGTTQKTYLADRKAANPAIKIAWGTSVDNGWTSGTRFVDRPAYNAAFAGNANIDYLVPLHLNTNVGIDGACPDGSPAGAGNTYFHTDGIHNLNPGHQEIANEFGTAWDALAV